MEHGVQGLNQWVLGQYGLGTLEVPRRETSSAKDNVKGFDTLTRCSRAFGTGSHGTLNLFGSAQVARRSG